MSSEIVIRGPGSVAHLAGARLDPQNQATRPQQSTIAGVIFDGLAGSFGANTHPETSNAPLFRDTGFVSIACPAALVAREENPRRLRAGIITETFGWCV